MASRQSSVERHTATSRSGANSVSRLSLKSVSRNAPTPVASNSRILPGFPPGKIDMRVERDARAPQHLIHVGAPDLALEAAVQRRSGGQGLRQISPELEIVAFGDRQQQGDPLLVVGRHGADKGDVDVCRRRFGQGVEDSRLEREVRHFRPDAERPERSHHARQLRDHEIVDAPVLAARRQQADLSDHDRVADALDAPDQTGVDMKDVLVEHQIGFELLDLGKQDVLGRAVEPGAQPDLAGERPQDRFERRHDTLQPRRRHLAAGRRAGWLRNLGRDAVLARPCGLKPGIVDVDLRRLVTQRRKIPGIEIGDAEQAGISRRHLRRIGSVLEPGLASIEPSQEARIIRVEHEDAHIF